MTTDVRFHSAPIPAAQDLTDPTTRFKALTIGGTIAANVNQAAGLLRTSCRSGETASVAYEGLTKAVAGAAITTPGFPLKITTSGFIIAASSGDATCGRYWQNAACASGDLIQGLFDFSDIGYWHG